MRKEERSVFDSSSAFYSAVHILLRVFFCLFVDRLLFGLLTESLNHATVLTHSDRMRLSPWDFSIMVSQALKEEVNMLNCLLKMSLISGKKKKKTFFSEIEISH